MHTVAQRGGSFHRTGRGPRTWDDVLLKCSDAALAAVVFLAPLFMGGRNPVGRAVYVALACAAAALYCMRQCCLRSPRWRTSGAEWVVLAGILLLALQLTPLPAVWLERVSPGVVRLLPLWTTDADGPVRLGPWSTVSLAPEGGRAGLVMLIAHTLLFITVLQRCDAREDVERFLTWLAWACVGMAVLGLAQYLFGNGKFLWIYAHPDRATDYSVRGAFQNQNHFAQFLALGLGPLIWLTRRILDGPAAEAASRPVDRRRGGRPTRKIILIAGFTGVGWAGLLTFSRGGLIALLTAMIVCTGAYWWKRLLGPKLVAGLGAVALAAALAVLTPAYEPLMRKLAGVQNAESLEKLSSGRTVLWRAMLKAAPHHLLFGAGVGSHPDLYPVYLDEDLPGRFSHGESGYLQVLLETGLAGVALLVAGIGIGLFWATAAVLRGDAPTAAAAAPLLGGLAASVVHSAVDFVWYIPACMSLTVVVLACACRLHQLVREERGTCAAPQASAVPRPCAFGGAAMVIVLAAAMIAECAPAAFASRHWDQYLALTLRVAGRSEWSTSGEQIAADSPALTARLYKHLDAALRRNPDDARIQLRMAMICLRMFDFEQQQAENAMTLKQIRDAALASRFSSAEDQNRWLKAAIGENRKYLDRAAASLHEAIHLCPLQGEAYVLLAELAFLNGFQHDAKRAYIAQAECLRPYEGLVLRAAGQEAALEGDLERALAHWKRAFHCDAESQHQLVDSLGAAFSAEQFLTHFAPDLEGARLIYSKYRQLGRTDDAKKVARRLLTLLEAEVKRQGARQDAWLWVEASQLHELLGDPQRAVKCSERAVDLARDNMPIRRHLGFQLLGAGRAVEAVAQFEHCLRYDSADESAKAGLMRAHAMRSPVSEAAHQSPLPPARR